MLEEALGWASSLPKETVVLIKDSVASPASFLFLHLLKKILASPKPISSDPLVIFVGLNEPLSHYSRVARKQGCNLAAYQDKGSLVFVDLLSVAGPILDKTTISVSNVSPNMEACSENKLFWLYQRFQTFLRMEPGRNAWIFIDDISLLEVVAGGNTNHLLDFIHYCRALSSNKQKCSLVLLVHQDVFQSTEEIAVAHQLEYWSDTVINVEPLATGHSSDVHGQVTIKHRTRLDVDCDTGLNMTSFSERNLQSFHYKLMENAALFFSPGKQF